MGLFRRKHDDTQAEPYPHPVPGLPQNPQTAQNSGIVDGILPAATSSNQQTGGYYTGFHDNAAPQPSSAWQYDDGSQSATPPQRPPSHQKQIQINTPASDQSDVDEDNDAPEYVAEPNPEPSQDYNETEPMQPESPSHSGETTFESPPQEFIGDQTEEPRVESVADEEAKPSEDELSQEIDNPPTPPLDNSNDELAEIKKQALNQLTPLASQLDQSPEERFHTTMMMQATDDQHLVKAAYEAANAITDDKARAQALLDVINKINYFTDDK